MRVFPPFKKPHFQKFLPEFLGTTCPPYQVLSFCELRRYPGSSGYLLVSSFGISSIGCGENHGDTNRHEDVFGAFAGSISLSEGFFRPPQRPSRARSRHLCKETALPWPGSTLPLPLAPTRLHTLVAPTHPNDSSDLNSSHGFWFLFSPLIKERTGSVSLRRVLGLRGGPLLSRAPLYLC